MKTLTSNHDLHDHNRTRRIVMANIVSESALPYSLYPMDTPEKSYEFWKQYIENEPDHEPEKETVVVVCLTARLTPFAWHRVSMGTCSESSAHPREILRPVIASNAFGFTVMHNHPSGDPTPSRADEQVTRRLVDCAALMQITFLDHAIVGRPSPGRSPYYSFREAGYIP